MSDKSSEFEAMVIPKGARIVAGEGAKIKLEVQGDLVLQESQKGLSSLVSHHGSILIDKGVSVKSSNIRCQHMIRIRGRLETDELKATNIMVEGGTIRCGELFTNGFECNDGEVETNVVKADEVKIRGGHVEIGSIAANSLKLENRVRGSILISSAKERHVDETVQIKGGFESDVELLGLLLKYRHEIMSDRVLEELKARKEGRELKRFFAQEGEDGAYLPGASDNYFEEKSSIPVDLAEPEPEPEPAPEEPIIPDIQTESKVIDISSGEAVSPIAEPKVEEPVSAETIVEEEEIPIAEDTVTSGPLAEKAVKARLVGYGNKLASELPDQTSLSALMKLILASLRQGDTQTLKAIFDRWSGNLEEEQKALSGNAVDLISQVRAFLSEVN